MIIYISEFPHKQNINGLKNVPLYSKRAEILCEKLRQGLEKKTWHWVG